MGWGGKGKGSWGFWGKGWGVQKPWLKKDGGASAPAVPADFKVSPTKRFKGTVSAYYKYQGYGFITPKVAGTVPGDKLFVHWTALKSEDRFPSLTKDMEVDFSITKENKKGKDVLGASNVSLPGGKPISVQDEADEKKTFVGGQHVRYTGTLKFFIPKQGFGYIKVDDGYEFKEEVPKEVRVELAEVNAGGKQPATMKEEVKVEFGIWKTQKGVFKAYNMTAEGGLPLPADETAA